MATILQNSVIRARIFILAALGPLIAGCSGMSDPQSMFSSGTLAPMAGDPCASARAEFAATQSYFTADIISGTLIGSVSAMGTDFASHVVAGNTAPKMTYADVLKDALKGGQAGYLAALAKRSSDEEEIVQQMSSDIHRDGQQADTLNTSFGRLESCRFRQASLIKSQARGGSLSQDGARAQLALERRLFDEELAVAQKTGKNMARRDDQFDYAAEQMNRPDVTPAASGRPRHAAGVAIASASLKSKHDTFVSAVSDAEVRSKDALGDDG